VNREQSPEQKITGFHFAGDDVRRIEPGAPRLFPGTESNNVALISMVLVVLILSLILSAMAASQVV
jgi:hypothetical protein